MKKIFALILALASFSMGVQNVIVPATTLTAVDGKLTTVARGYNSVLFQVTGTWSATITFEGTLNGSTWVAISGTDQNAGTSATTATANGMYVVSGTGMLNVRARVSAYTSGSVVITAMTVEGGSGGGSSGGGGPTSNVAVTSSVLPTGAATAAKQPALGTAGSSSTDVISVQGIASGTALPVSVASIPSHAVTNAGTFAVQAAESGTWTVQPGNTANTTAWKVDNSAVTQPVSYATTGSGTATGALRVELPSNGTGVIATVGAVTAITNALPVGANVIGALTANQSVNVAQVNGVTPLMGNGVTGTGSQRVTIASDNTAFSVNANAGTNLNTSALALDATLGRAQGSATSGQTGPIVQGAVTTAAPSYTTAQTSPLSLTTTGALRVDASAQTLTVGSHAVTNAGTFAVQAAESGTWTVQPGNTANTTPWLVAGQAASAAAIAGNPVRIGYRAGTADFTATTDAQQVDGLATTTGKAIFLPYALRANDWVYAAVAGGLVTTAGVTIKAAAGSGIRNCVTSMQVMNSHQTIGTEVVLRDGAAGTVIWRGWAQFAGGGMTAPFPVQVCGSANTLLEIAEVTATATAGVLVSAQGYAGAE